MKSMPRMGLKTKLYVSMFILLSLMALAVGWFFLHKGKAMLREEYRKRGLSMARTASQQLEYGLLTADEKNVQEGLAPYLSDPDLIGIHAYSCAQEQLFSAGKTDSNTDKIDPGLCATLTPEHRELTQQLNDRFRFFMLTKGVVPKAPALDSGLGADSMLGVEPKPEQPAVNEKPLPIGLVRVDLSLDNIKKAETDFTQFVIIVVLSITLAALVLLGFLAQRMVGPIHQLVSKVKIIGSGNLDVRIPPMGRDEIGDLAEAFANMKDNLKANMGEIERSNRELRDAQKRLEQKVNEISALYELEKGIGAIFELDQLLEYITERAMKVLDAEAGSLLLAREDSDELEFKVAKGPKAGAVKNFCVKFGEGIAGWTAQNREPVLCEQVAGDPRYSGTISREIEYPVRDALCVPMTTADNRVIGVVELMNKQGPSPFNEADLRLLVLISGQASKAIERARYIERERQLAAELSQARLKAEYLSKIEQAYEEKTLAYEQLRETQQQLVQSEKLATVGTLAGGVAHEINNPLGAILTNAQMIDLYSSQEDIKANVKNIVEGARRCKSIVEKLLSYSRPSKRDRAEVSINQVVDDTLTLLGHQLLVQNINVEVEHGATKPIQANANEISQVLTNLILNSAFAVNENAKTQGPDFKMIVRVVTQDSEKDPGVRVRVEDNGTGIAAENLDKIFDPFFTTKVVGQGTGLGLSVSSNIIRAHGGRMDVESKMGQGTVFTVFLPVMGRAAADSDAAGAEG